MFFARNFSEVFFGTFSALNSSILLIATISMVGTNWVLVRYVNDEKKNRKNLFETTFTMVLITSFISTNVSFFSMIYLVFDGVPEIANPLGLYLTYLFSGLFYTLWIYLDAVFISMKKSIYMLIKNYFFGITRVFIPLLLIFLDFNGFYFSWFIALVMSVLLGGILAWRNGFPLLRISFDVGLVKDLLPYLSGNYLVSVLDSTYANLTVMIVTAKFGEELTAIYNMAWIIGRLFYFIPLAISSALIADKVSKDKKSDYTRAIVLSSLIILVGFGFYIFLSSYLYNFIGKNYSNSLYLTSIFIVSAIPAGIVLVYFSKLRILEKTRELVVVKIFQVSLFFVLMFFFMIPQGIDGIGNAWLLAQLILATWAVLRIYFYTH